MRHRFPATVRCLAIVGVALAGCSSDSGNAAVAVKVVVDGKAQPTDNKVACVTAHNMVMANIGNDQDDIAVTLSAGDDPVLEELSFGKIDGLSLTYDESNPGPGPKPTVTKAGSNYHIVGSATSPDPTGPGTVSKAFDIEFTCAPKR